MPRIPRLLLACALASAPLAVACSKPHAGATPHAVDHVQLPLAPRVVGIRWTKVDDTTTDLRVGTGSTAVPVGGKRHHRSDNEILAVDADGLVTKVAVSYPEWVDVSVGADAPDAAPPLRGRSYVAWIADGVIAATHADGSAVSDAELKELSGDQDELGRPPVMEQIMASRTWKLGETYVLGAPELMRLASSKGGVGPQATALNLTLRRVVGADAEFAMVMKLESTESVTMTIDVTGTVTIDTATGRPQRLEISGPVTGAAAGMPITGTMTGLITYAFTGP